MTISVHHTGWSKKSATEFHNFLVIKLRVKRPQKRARASAVVRSVTADGMMIMMIMMIMMMMMVMVAVVVCTESFA